MKPFLVDVPVRIMIWNRPDCMRKQFEVLRQARPSILFLISDGGRTKEEMELIKQSRAVFDAIDWECQVHKFYFESNNGMYAIGKEYLPKLWALVDRCIFLEDDYVPAVSYFSFCAELLEKYKDDERIARITGFNPFETYPDAEPYDYFFSENGWAIWGSAYWRRNYQERSWPPLPYANNEYIMRCLNDNLSWFWQQKLKGYAAGKLVENHAPGSEFYIAMDSALYHRVSIIPTRNMISNIGVQGAHFSGLEELNDEQKKWFFSKTYEIDGPIKHPEYVIDDKHYGRMYEKNMGHLKPNYLKLGIRKFWRFWVLLFQGKLWGRIQQRLHPTIEK